MPRAPKPLPEGFTIDSASARVSCNLCAQEGIRKWLQKDSVRGHMTTKEHLACVERSRNREIDAIEQARNALSEYQHHGTLNHVAEDDFTYQMEMDGTDRVAHSYFTHELLADENGNDYLFTIGNAEEHARRAAKLQEDFIRYQHYGWMDELLDQRDDDIGETNISQALHAGDLLLSDDEDSENPLEDINLFEDNGWYPYRNKTMLLLDMLDNLPRLRLSDSQMRAILFVMKEAGANNVPSLSTLRRLQARLRKAHSVPVRQHISGRGSVFYTYDINGQIAKDFANPLVRPHLHLYPEEMDTELFETWNGTKWCKDLDDSLLTPMALGENNEHFYINELARTRCNRFLIPRRWVIKAGSLFAYSHLLNRTVDGKYEILGPERRLVALHDMADSFLTLQEQSPEGEIFMFADGRIINYHPLRLKAAGKPCFAVQMKLWADDVSGNRSKQWNKHWVWCMAHAGLPKTLLHQEYFIRYISCSQNATVLEQASAICDQIRESQDGIVAFDAELQQEIIFFVNMFQLSGDNPMLAELSSHIGLTGNLFCYRCKIGGTKEYKITTKGYEELFSPGPSRTVAYTKSEVEKQLADGLKGVSLEDSQRLSGVKDTCVQYWLQQAESLQKDEALEDICDNSNFDAEAWIKQQKEVKNPLLDLVGFDAHLDGPVEPLHTVLLGVVKYCWTLTCEKIVSGKKLGVFQTRLQSIDTRGMNIPTLRASYLIQYRGALIGRQFKAIMQVMVFVLYGLLPKEFILLWRALGEVGAYLWHPYIKDKDAYLEKLTEAIDNYLDCLVAVDSARIVSKPKCHILTHIIEDIKRFGPPILLSTEMFEGFNGVWRLCSILSNHHAPSRDIAMNMADMDRFKQLLSGVQWKEKDKMVKAGLKVRQFMNSHPELQNYIGWVQKTSLSRAGEVTLAAKKKFPSKIWHETEASQAIPYYSTDVFDDNASFNQCSRVIAANGDCIKVENFVVAQKENDQDTIIGRVLEIVQLQRQDFSHPSKNIITVERYSLGSQHNTLAMPTIHRYEETVKVRMDAKHLKFVLNVQHDCERGLCKVKKVRETQERAETTRDIQVIQHSDSEHYIINVQSLHNVHLVRTAIPERYYTIPKATDNRAAFHATLAEELQKKSDLRKATANARREATKKATAQNARANEQ